MGEADSVHPERAFKTWRYWVNQLNRRVFGRHWQGTEHRGVFWVRAAEFQARGVIHYHALMSAYVDLNTLARRLDWMDRWLELAGFSKIEASVDQTATVKYVTKYVVKGGDIDVSENLKRYFRQEDWLR
ncbi:MAG: rolling circle replication-associated protein [Gammaproteobacteria bacterium]